MCVRGATVKNVNEIDQDVSIFNPIRKFCLSVSKYHGLVDSLCNKIKFTFINLYSEALKYPGL